MDSATLLGVVGISGTLLGTVVGALGTLGSAAVTNRGQSAVEEQKARRQAYSVCSTALMVRRDDAIALMEAFRDDGFDQAAVQAQLQSLDEQRAAVARAVGAVAVEGPSMVALAAEQAAGGIGVMVGRMRDWAAAVDGGRDREELVSSQFQFGRENEDIVRQQVETFSVACRKVLHPAEPGFLIPRPRRRFWRR